MLTDIAVRLRNEDHFPWGECVKLLVKLHPPTALAAVSRWSDQGIRDHAENLQYVLSEMGRLDALSPTLASALLALIPNVPNELRMNVVARLKTIDQALAEKSVELLAEDILLREEPTSIGWQADRFTGAVSSLGLKPEGQSYRRLIETNHYLKHIKPVGQPNKTSNEKAPALLGQIFKTPASIEAEFKRARQSEGYFSAGPFLIQMVDTISAPADRVPFLDALSASDLGEYNEPARVEVILAALSKWDTPSVNHWRSHKLPRVIIQRFLGLTQLYRWEHDPLNDILAATRLGASEKLAILAEGLEETSLTLGSRALFAISEQMAKFLTPNEAWIIFKWYLDRIVSRVSLDESAIKLEDIPERTEESIGRFLFALMGDIDTRIRWRAAHATRRLARLGESTALEAIFAQYDRTSDNAFRDPTAPYYALAGRLWTVISSARIAHEAPLCLQGVHARLVSIATDRALPHILIREYAKAALISLHDCGVAGLDNSTLGKIREINVSPFPIDERKDHAAPRLQWSDKKDRRFDFGMDTAEYTLSPILRMFIGLSKDELFDRMEHWLVDQWQTPEKVHYWDHEPRKTRYDERRYGLYHSDKGSMPIMERRGFYLEWHTVLCVVGELLQKYPLWGAPDRWGTFQDWFAKLLFTIPPVWLADLRDSKPLEDQFWVEGAPDENRWVSRIARKDFLAALFAKNATDKSVVNVDGSWTSAFPTREVSATISSALVNPATANSLVRSLSVRERRQWAYHLPDADSDHEHDERFREMPYKLVGWLVNVRHDEGFDIKDTWRNGTKGPGKSLAETVLTELQLKPSSLPVKGWTIIGSNKIAAREFVWADLPERYDYDGGSYRRRDTKSEGTLLQIDADVLMSFLQKQQMSLVVSVHFERRLENEYGGSYDDKTKKIKTFEQFFIFRTDGTIEDHQGAIGTWWRARRTVQA